MKNAYQKDFFEKLSMIQENTVQMALAQYQSGADIEDLLYEVTYDVLADMMTWIDGYSNFSNNPMDIVDMCTGQSLKKDPFIELHDAIADYLKFEKSIK